MEYIVQKYAPESRLKVPASEPGFADFVYWYYYAIGSLQSQVETPALLQWAGVDRATNPLAQRLDQRMKTSSTLR